MAKLKFKPGNIVYKGNKKYEVYKVTSLKSVIVKDAESGKLEEVPIGHLSAGAEGAPTAGTPDIRPEAVSDEHWEVARRRYEIIKPLLSPDRTKQKVIERAQEFGINPTTIYEWMNKYETLETLSALVPEFTGRGGKGRGRIDPATEAVIKKTIDDVLESGARKSFQSIMKSIQLKCRNAGIEMPHVNTVRRRFQGRPRRKIQIGRAHV